MSMRKEKANLAAVLEAFLDDVVAKHVLHEGYGMRLHLLKHCHCLLWWYVCQLLLYEATAMLIPAEVVHIPFDVLHHIVTVKSKVITRERERSWFCGCLHAKLTVSPSKGDHKTCENNHGILHHIATVNLAW